ncbi:hypothetical protein YC2023_054838 [Brassica napus]
MVSLLRMVRLHDKVVPRLLRPLVVSTTIYFICSQRNERYYVNISSQPTIIFKLLDRFITNALLFIRNQKQSCGLMQNQQYNLGPTPMVMGVICFTTSGEPACVHGVKIFPYVGSLIIYNKKKHAGSSFVSVSFAATYDRYVNQMSNSDQIRF